MDISDIIKKYDTIITEYVQKIVKPSFPFLEDEKSKYEIILQKLLKFYWFTNYISSLKMETNDEHEKVLFTIYNKAALDLLGIYFCLDKGLEIQAGILYRSLFENYLNTELIFESDTKERLKLFSNFQYVDRWNHINDHLVNDGLDYFKGTTITNVYINKCKIKNDELIEDYNIKLPYHWAYKILKDKIKRGIPSLLDICRYLGDDFVNDYNMVYATFSKSTHPSAIIGDYYAESTQYGTSMSNSPKYTDSLPNIVVISLTHCEFIIEKIISYFKIDDYENIIIYLRILVDEIHLLGKSIK